MTFPTLLNDRTLLYLATDDEGYGPWIYAMDVERRIPHRIFAGVDPYTSLAASADGRRLVATVSRSTARLWRVPIARPRDGRIRCHSTRRCRPPAVSRRA